MKKLVLLAVFLCLSVTTYATEISEQKFKVIFTITYNELTLREAAEKEAFIKEVAKDACKVDLEIKKASDLLEEVWVRVE